VNTKDKSQLSPQQKRRSKKQDTEDHSTKENDLVGTAFSIEEEDRLSN